VRAVAVDRTQGREVVWFGTDAGAARWDGVAIEVFTTADGLASNDVQAIDIDTEGNVWLASMYGGVSVRHFDSGEWRTFTTEDGLVANGVWAVVADPRGGVWVASSSDEIGGVSRFDGTAWTGYTGADGLISDGAFDIAVDSRGHVWFATLGGISEFQPEAESEPPTPTPTRAPGPAYVPRAERP
jgi:ligand-binding sensor domain-containing protein